MYLRAAEVGPGWAGLWNQKSWSSSLSFSSFPSACKFLLIPTRPRRVFWELFKGSVPQLVPHRVIEVKKSREQSCKQPLPRILTFIFQRRLLPGHFGRNPGDWDVGMWGSRALLRLCCSFPLPKAHSSGIHSWSWKIHLEFLWHARFQLNSVSCWRKTISRISQKDLPKSPKRISQNPESWSCSGWREISSQGKQDAAVSKKSFPSPGSTLPGQSCLPWIIHPSSRAAPAHNSRH